MCIYNQVKTSLDASLAQGKLPFPRIKESVAQWHSGMPTKDIVGFGRVCPDLSYISGPPRGYTMRHLDTCGRLECVNQLTHRHSSSSADIKYLHRSGHSATHDSVNGTDVSLGKVGNIYVVTYACPVRSVVIISEHA